ncbi:MAG: hypothetical protein AAF580_11220 [Pseudomonadota bacterium]
MNDDYDVDPYNTVFERLIPEHADQKARVHALIAYGLYKQAKRDWVRSYQKRTGQAPDEAAYKAFADTQNDAVLEAYRSEASQIANDHAEDAVKARTPAIVQNAVKGSFAISFWSSLLANMVFATGLLLLALISAVMGFGLPVQIHVAPIG